MIRTPARLWSENLSALDSRGSVTRELLSSERKSLVQDLLDKVVRTIFHRNLRSSFLRPLLGRLYDVYSVRREPEVSGTKPFEPKVMSSKIRAEWTAAGLRNLAPRGAEELGFRDFKDVLLSPNRRGGFILSDGDLLLPATDFPPPDRVYVPNQSVGGVVGQNSQTALLRTRRRPVEIENAIFCGSMAPHNWFHWIIDTLPTLLLARKLPRSYDDFPALIPDVILAKSAALGALEVVLSGRAHVAVTPDDIVRISHLVRIDGATRSFPRPLEPVAGPRLTYYAEALGEYRDTLLAEFGLEKLTPIPGNRIFLSRMDSEKREYNHDEIEKAAEGMGFRKVYLEGMSLQDSIAVFREAEAIIGPHGAGWATMLFCKRQTKTLLWKWPGEAGGNWFENLALVSGVHYLQIDLELNSHERHRPSVQLNVEAFLAALTQLGISARP